MIHSPETSNKMIQRELAFRRERSGTVIRFRTRIAPVESCPAGLLPIAGLRVAKLLAEGLIEEIQSRGPLPVWRRDGDNADTLRITRRGRQAIRLDDEATGANELPKKPPVHRDFAPKKIR